MRNVNVPLSSTYAATLSCIKSVITSSGIPFNEGREAPDPHHCASGVSAPPGVSGAGAGAA